MKGSVIITGAFNTLVNTMCLDNFWTGRDLKIELYSFLGYPRGSGNFPSSPYAWYIFNRKYLNNSTSVHYVSVKTKVPIKDSTLARELVKNCKSYIGSLNSKISYQKHANVSDFKVPCAQSVELFLTFSFFFTPWSTQYSTQGHRPTWLWELHQFPEWGGNESWTHSFLGLEFGACRVMCHAAIGKWEEATRSEWRLEPNNM